MWSPWVHLGCLWEAPVALQNLENRALDSDDQKKHHAFLLPVQAVESLRLPWNIFRPFGKPLESFGSLLGVGAAALGPFGTP